MAYKNKKLTALIHKCPCMAKFPHQCSMYLPVDPPALYAVESAHADSSIFGRAFGSKSPDWAIAAMCHTAHMALDSKELAGLKDTEWKRAYKLTWDYIWENKLIKVT